ncbi:hypothetical protein AKJ64_04105 [candidate division MSBL1 archaeon SCGC-AAA259E17]|uniref:Uncharacterized protein n=1 Tax=candidate division MSBL1 archaeon SCGC-AAA259E17 TaxID=1698263 RepID=A0A133UD11_9EURY|nr:hypothetical protein AKJ64_04105 [candidate division MSBL1 archaeon SCGC-AAA259E17]
MTESGSERKINEELEHSELGKHLSWSALLTGIFLVFLAYQPLKTIVAAMGELGIWGSEIGEGNASAGASFSKLRKKEKRRKLKSLFFLEIPIGHLREIVSLETFLQ